MCSVDSNCFHESPPRVCSTSCTLSVGMYVSPFVLPSFTPSFPLIRAFDVELLFIAQSVGIPLVEVGVNWQEIDGASVSLYLCCYHRVSFHFFTRLHLIVMYCTGSKLDPLTSSIQMGRDLFLIRAYYMTGFWSLKGARV